MIAWYITPFRENSDFAWLSYYPYHNYWKTDVLCVPELSYQNFDAILLKKVTQIWQYPFAEQNVVAF